MDANKIESITPMYNIVSTMAYLIGVEERFFSDDSMANFEINIFEELEGNKNAKIIRNLCKIRTQFMKCYGRINECFFKGNNIDTVPEYIPVKAVNELADFGINLRKERPVIYEYIAMINQEICSKIFYCKELFPIWFEWDYLRELFIMPEGNKQRGIKAELIRYSSNKNMYPFQNYINWQGEEVGNILHNDEKFAVSVYFIHNKQFMEKSLVRKVGEKALLNINEFISSAENVLIVVDCENTNPIKLAAFLISLSEEEKGKIHKIMFYNSNQTPAEWETMFDSYIKGFRAEINNIERLYQNKSQVDMSLAVDTTKEVYKNGIDAVILVSSDSDYWAMIKCLPETKFMMMIEAEKSGKIIRKTLEDNGYNYCFLDDFYTGTTFAIKSLTVRRLIQKELDRLAINIKDSLVHVAESNYLQMSESEEKQFYDNYVKKASIEIDDDGRMRIVLGGR